MTNILPMLHVMTGRYPIVDNFVAVLLTVWMPVALNKQFNDNSDTATMVIACYALLGGAGQYIQSNPR